MANFEELRTRIKIEDLATMLGIETKPVENKPAQLRAMCPKCQRGKNDLSIGADRQRFTCWSSKQNGDVVDFFQHIQGITSKADAGTALKKLLDAPPEAQAAPQGTTRPPEHLQKLRDNLVRRPDGIKDKVKAEAFSRIGLTEETLEHFDAGYSPQGTMAGRLLVGLHTLQGQLVGFVGIALDAKEPRYVFPNNITRESIIFNIHRVRQAQNIIVADDPLDVLMGYETGETDVICFLDHH